MKISRFFRSRALAVVAATCLAATGFTAVTAGTAFATGNTYTLTDTDNHGGVFFEGTVPEMILTASVAITGTASDADATQVTDTLPTGLLPGIGTGTNWSCSANLQVATCNYTAPPELTGTALPAISLPVTVTNTAATGSQSDAATAGSADAVPGAAHDTFTVDGPPGAPTAVTATAGASAATVSFSAPASNGGSAVTGYAITPVLTGTAQTVQTFNSTATTETVSGLTPGGSYTFEVAAVNAVGTGANSAPSNAVIVNGSPGGGSPAPTTTVPTTTVPPTSPGPPSYPAPTTTTTTTAPPAVALVATGGSTAETPGGLGYWSLSASGQLSEHGNAVNYGSENAFPHNSRIVGIASTTNGEGYWLVSANGGVFTFGDAKFHGSLGAKHINKPIVGIVGTPDNGGYILAASDGGVFAFGDATFHGSLGNKHLNQPIVGILPSPDGLGYMMLGADGGVFAFGDTYFEGSLGAGANKHIVAMAQSPTGKGYWLVGTGGTVYTFGDAKAFGSVPAKSGDKITGIIANGDEGYRLITASGTSIAFGTVPAS